MEKNIADKILSKIEQGYDSIADKFSATRQSMWWDLEFIKDFVKTGDAVLDFGCGNGRLLEILGNKKIDYRGVDVSGRLIDLARKKYPEFSENFVKISGQNSLPFADNFFNAAVSLAVFHHFPSRAFREERAREIFRVLKPGGAAIVSVWNLWRKKYVAEIAKNWLQKFSGKSELDWNDCRIAFRGDEGDIFYRFHHAFTKREMSRLFQNAGFETERCETTEKGNMVFVGRKKF